MIVDLDKAVEIVDKVIVDAAKNGIHGYVRPGGDDSGCFYVHRYTENGSFLSSTRDGEVATREPGCIVGRVAIELGVPIDQINFECEGYFSRRAGLGLKMNNEFGITFTDGAYDFLKILQSRQDQGCEWATARHEALKDVRENYS